MASVIPQKQAPHYAGLELNALLAAGAIPETLFAGAQISRVVTPIYDINGQILFYRVPVTQKQDRSAWADIAAFEGFGALLLALSRGFVWDEDVVLKYVTAAARKHVKGLRFDDIRFVAYSYPKVAAQFRAGDKEVLMVEVATGAVVPVAERRAARTPPGNFERWSFIDELPHDRLNPARKAIARLIGEWDDLCPPLKLPKGFNPQRLTPDIFRGVFKPRIVSDTRELHYSTNLADHFTCFELRGQQTNVWCVAASTQMVLDFYRYNYAQTRVAQELGLGTLTNPTGLPYSRDGDVVTTLEALSSSALDATMNTAPSWAEFRTEIRANRPLISFIPGHSRAVAGYTSTRLFTWYIFRGLLVYDPWPPTGGVITRWENFDASTYRVTFTAHVTLVP